MPKQKKNDDFEHQRRLLIRSVFSKLNSTDAIAEFLLDEEYLMENLGMASLYLGYKQSVDDSARHYASLLKEKLDASKYDTNLIRFIKSMYSDDALAFWYELSHSGIFEEQSSNEGDFTPNLFFGSNTRIPLSELSKKEFIKMMYGGQEPPTDNFANALTYLMKENKIKISELAEKTGIDDRTIRRMRNNVNYRPSFKKVVAVCIAMHLYPRYSNHLLTLAGLTPRYNNAAEKIYMILLYLYYESSVYECNEFLRKVNIEPLTDL